jgi:hypothetical protein
MLKILITWGRRLYFPSEGRRAVDFMALKNPSPSAGFEPANLESNFKHANHLTTEDDKVVTYFEGGT